MKPCKSHITALRKVNVKLAWNLTMSGSTLMLSNENQTKLMEAEVKIAKAIQILKTIE